MSNPDDKPESGPQPRLHSRDLGIVQGKLRNARSPTQGASPQEQRSVGQPRQTSLPVRWARQSLHTRTPATGHQAVGVYPARPAWRRWFIAISAAAVLLLLGLGLAGNWLGPRLFSREGREAASGASNSGSTVLAPPGNEIARLDQPSGSTKRNSEPDIQPHATPKADLSELGKIVVPSLVTIDRGLGRGTGFVIDGGLVVTAYHVVPLDKSATVIYDSGERAKVIGWVAYDDLSDVIVLRTDAKGHPQGLTLATALPKKGEHVASFSPGESEIQGDVTEIRTGASGGSGQTIEMLCSTLNAVPGWSGGPVVNMRGEVVGVNSRLDGQIFETQGQRIGTGSAASPITAVNRLLTIVRLSEKIQTNPNDIESLRSRAALYLAKGDFGKAINDYSSLIELQPTQAETFFRRGSAYDMDRNFDRAVADYTRAIELRKDYVEAYEARAAVCEKRTRRDEAIGDYVALLKLLPEEKARSIEAKLIDAYKARARALAAVAQWDKAIEDVSKILEMRHSDIESRQLRATLYKARGSYDKAVEDYTELIRLRPTEAEFFRLRGLVRTAKGDHDDAIADFTRAIRINPKDAKAYCARGLVYSGHREFQQAIADYTQAIELDDSSADAYADRGSAYQALGRNAEAERDFQKARELKYQGLY